MVQTVSREAIAARSPLGAVWRTADDRWTLLPQEAEILGDEAHAQLRLIETLAAAGDVADIRLTAAPS